MTNGLLETLERDINELRAEVVALQMSHTLLTIFTAMEINSVGHITKTAEVMEGIAKAVQQPNTPSDNALAKKHSSTADALKSLAKGLKGIDFKTSLAQSDTEKVRKLLESLHSGQSTLYTDPR